MSRLFGGVRGSIPHERIDLGTCTLCTVVGGIVRVVQNLERSDSWNMVDMASIDAAGDVRLVQELSSQPCPIIGQDQR